jgi:hypothetical protein
VFASDDAVTIDGEAFTNKFIGSPPNGDKLIEFIRSSETFENWTKLVGYRYQQLPKLDNDPRKTALSLERIVKMKNPRAKARVITNKRTNEAIIDFLTWPKDGKYMEFNVFRYTKSPDGKAVVSLQLAYRFTEASPKGIEKFKKIRSDWVRQAAAFDMKKIHSSLALPGRLE